MAEAFFCFFTYLVTYNCGAVLFGRMLPDGADAAFSLLSAALLSAAAVLFIMHHLFHTEPDRITAFRREPFRAFFYFAGTVAAGLLLNALLSSIPFLRDDGAFRAADAALRDGSRRIRILTEGIVIPFTEELVFRKGVEGSLLNALERRKSAQGTEKKPCESFLPVLFSSLLFGIIHFNMVQCIYACAVGILLGVLYRRYRDLYYTWLCHGLLNLVVILFY